jgi:DNA-binding beta-propeller fold protein YncE
MRRSSAAVLPLLALCALAAPLAGCDLFGDDAENASLPEGPALVAQTDGDEPALWLFDPQTLERTAVVETENRAPRGVAFSPNYERWYLSWGTGSKLDGDARNVLATLDPASGRITKRTSTPDLSVGGGQLIYEPQNDHIVSYGNGGGDVQFFDAETLKLEHEQAIGSFVGGAAVAEEREKIYFGIPSRIYVYDVAEQEISSTIPLPGPPPSFSDAALSPDERYLFATTYSTLGGPGRFYMVDLDTGETIFDESPVGKKANLAVSPDGRYVYIDCPAGAAGRSFVPFQKVLRFDVKAREMEVFIDGGEALGLDGYALATNYITMLPGGEAFVIQNRAAGLIEGEPLLIKVDAETGERLATYDPPRSDEGWALAIARHLYSGTVPE